MPTAITEINVTVNEAKQIVREHLKEQYNLNDDQINKFDFWSANQEIALGLAGDKDPFLFSLITKVCNKGVKK